MSDVLFPAGLTVDFRDINIEEMEFYARAWNLQRAQMQKGLFVGSMIVVHTPNMQLMRAPYSHGVLMQGDFPKGTVLIAAVVTKADVTFQDSVAGKHEIRILRSGDEIDFLCNGESETFTVAIEEKFFDDAYYSYFGQEFHVSGKNKQVYVNPQFLSRFTQGIEEWISYLMQDHDPLKLEVHYERIESQILEHVFSSIYMEEGQKLRQKFQIKKARDLLHESIGEASSITSLAQELGISERLLHHAFKENYGFTPKKYLLNLRMHHIRQELLRSNPETATISSVAEKYHLYNQSTFTQAYRQMFGEIPSLAFQRSL